MREIITRNFLILKEDTINQRISLLVQELDGGNKLAFSKRIGMSNQGLGEIIGDRQSTPSFPKLTQMLRALPQVRMEWLLLGEGEMLKSADTPKNNSVYDAGQAEAQQPVEAASEDKLRVLTVQVAPDGDENIEMVPVWAAAGYAAGGFTQPLFMSKLPHFRLPGAAYRNGSFRCFEVHGSSMQGTLADGDWVICRYIEKWAHDILDNRVYVIVTEQDVLVKRVLNQINERGMLSLHSDNPSFDVQFMDWHDVREVWQGVARITRDLTNTRLDIPLELARQQASIAELFQRMQVIEGRDSTSSDL